LYSNCEATIKYIHFSDETTFNVVDTVGIRDDKTVQQLQDEAQLLLGKYVRHARPDEPSRFGKLLLTVPCIRAASSTAVSDVLFNDPIGTASVDRVVVDIYRQMSNFTAK